MVYHDKFRQANELSRIKAREAYQAKPNLCLLCSKTILLKEGVDITEIKKKKFCNSSCAAKYNNRKRERNRTCSCGEPVRSKRGKLCNSCFIKIRYKGQLPIEKRTKGELFSSRKNWQSARNAIRKHAEKVFFAYENNYKCDICGYSRHVEVAHLKAVQDFQDSALISEINNIYIT